MGNISLHTALVVAAGLLAGTATAALEGGVLQVLCIDLQPAQEAGSVP